MTADDASGTVRSIDETMMMILGNDDMMIRSARRFEPRRGRRDDGEKVRAGISRRRSEASETSADLCVTPSRVSDTARSLKIIHTSTTNNRRTVFHFYHLRDSRKVARRARHFDWSILESFSREMAAFRRRGDDETAPDKLRAPTCGSHPRSFRRGARHDGVRRVRSRERGHAGGESSREFHGYGARAIPLAPRSLRALDVSHPRADGRVVDRHP